MSAGAVEVHEDDQVAGSGAWEAPWRLSAARGQQSRRLTRGRIDSVVFNWHGLESTSHARASGQTPLTYRWTARSPTLHVPSPRAVDVAPRAVAGRARPR